MEENSAQLRSSFYKKLSRFVLGEEKGFKPKAWALLKFLFGVFKFVKFLGWLLKAYDYFHDKLGDLFS